MKSLIFLIAIFPFAILHGQNSELNGMIFKGTATEITPPDVDRMPVFFNITLIFENGSLRTDAAANYSINESAYSSEIDGRRMIALKVVNFKANTSGSINDENANIEFSGEVYGDAKLSGVMTIKFHDDRKVKFNLNATAE